MQSSDRIPSESHHHPTSNNQFHVENDGYHNYRKSNAYEGEVITRTPDSDAAKGRSALSNRELKSIFTQRCQLESVKQSTKWYHRFPKSILLIHESIDKFRPTSVTGRLTRCMTANQSEHNTPPSSADEIIEQFIQSKEGKRLYRKAASNNFSTIEEYMRNSGVDINHKCPKSGNTPLVAAAVKGYWNLVDQMIDKGATVNTKNIKYRDVLIEVLEGNLDITRKYHVIVKIIEKEILEITNRQSLPKFLFDYFATIAQSGNVLVFERVEKTILDKINIKEWDKVEMERILGITADSQNNTAEMIEYLLNLKNIQGNQLVDPNATNLSGKTALMIAASNGKEAEVKALLKDQKVRKEINKRNSEKKSTWTAYTYADKNKHNSITRILLNNGAELLQAPSPHSKVSSRRKSSGGFNGALYFGEVCVSGACSTADCC